MPPLEAAHVRWTVLRRAFLLGLLRLVEDLQAGTIRLRGRRVPLAGHGSREVRTVLRKNARSNLETFDASTSLKLTT